MALPAPGADPAARDGRATPDPKAQTVPRADPAAPDRKATPDLKAKTAHRVDQAVLGKKVIPAVRVARETREARAVQAAQGMPAIQGKAPRGNPAIRMATTWAVGSTKAWPSGGPSMRLRRQRGISPPVRLEALYPLKSPATLACRVPRARREPSDCKAILDLAAPLAVPAVPDREVRRAVKEKTGPRATKAASGRRAILAVRARTGRRADQEALGREVNPDPKARTGRRADPAVPVRKATPAVPLAPRVTKEPKVRWARRGQREAIPT